MNIYDARERCMNVFKAAEMDGEKVAVHCTGGIGRAGRVLAAWLSIRYGLTPQDAMKEIMEHAEAVNCTRGAHTERLAQFVAMGYDAFRKDAVPPPPKA